ncbi:MAG: TonB family protein [Bacteroidales bacterium]|nr:TonB family protein [Bacteroidales bacterium]MBN2817798.1 TonB family protein [Bacteroidales bacterium]
MEVKKSTKANLENKRGVFVEYGLVLVLAILLLAFEWSASLKDNSLIDQMQDVVAEEEMIITRQQPPEPPPPPPPPQVIEMLTIVEDDVEIEEIDFESMEADEDMSLDLVPFEEEEEAAEEEVFVIVEDMPSFKGGDLNEFRNWVGRNLKYPEIAAENGISGRVFVQFAVNSSGQVVDVVVVRGVDQALDTEAVRVIQSSPKWTPGKQRGRPVKVQFTFPVVFVLQ